MKYINLFQKILYQITNGAIRAPKPIIISIPHIAQCNHRCRFCEIIGVEAKLKKEGKIYQSNIFLPEQIQMFNDFIKKAEYIDFGGLTSLGEPLLSPYFTKIINNIRKVNKKAIISITTNGVFLDKKMTLFLKKKGFLKITFSLHAITESTYGKSMGKDFNKVINNIKYFCDKTRNNKQIDKVINFGIGKYNFKDSLKILDFAKESEINVINIYPYYKSPNSFDSDASLYSNPELANNVLKKVYKKAKTMNVKLHPEKPAFIINKININKNIKTYSGGCQSPYNYFILKSNPYQKDTMSLSVCNRLALFQIDMSKKIETIDINWAWNHSVVKELRLAKTNRIPLICKFCKDPRTQFLRSLDHQKYIIKRNKLVRDILIKHFNNRFSPNHSIVLLQENIYSL